jgi:hypothetical protein
VSRLFLSAADDGEGTGDVAWGLSTPTPYIVWFLSGASWLECWTVDGDVQIIVLTPPASPMMTAGAWLSLLLLLCDAAAADDDGDLLPPPPPLDEPTDGERCLLLAGEPGCWCAGWY